VSFAIIAQFPLGTYRGHAADGELDHIPSPARLHAALLNAAAQGPRARIEREGLAPSDDDRAALAWVEANPPDALRLPATLVNDAPVIAYRAEGMLGKQAFKVRRDRAAETVALGGPVAWIWNDEPPPPVRDAISELCGDVSHLGTAESPVVLRVGPVAPTHSLDRAASRFVGDGVDLLIPLPGRTDALEAAYRRAVGVAPTATSDRPKANETERRSSVPRAALATARYVPIEEPRGQAPWANVILLPVDEDIPPQARLAWCVALHRALVSLIGDGAPPVVTGRYPSGVRRPANRIAIQYLHGSLPLASPLGSPGAFALLVPSGVDPEEMRILGRAIRSLSELRLSRTRATRVGADVRAIAGDQFWRPMPPGHARVWVTEPAAVPDSRRVGGASWTLDDVALLSLGLVWRDEVAEPGTGSAWYGRLAQAARDRGAHVLAARKLVGGNLDRFVHRIAEGTVAQPYRAVLTLGTLAGERTIVAIGQSRHLGGGLLVPLDVPVEGPVVQGIAQ
jgi:CRISPR-associated protein Csb2